MWQTNGNGCPINKSGDWQATSNNGALAPLDGNGKGNDDAQAGFGGNLCGVFENRLSFEFIKIELKG